jgi:hypothetical protein
MLVGGAVWAGEVESRDFSVSVDGKPAGDYHMTITAEPDGSVTMAGQADIKVNYLIFNYRYTIKLSETWKGSRLTRFASSCNDDGKRYAVSATQEGRGLKVKVNGQEHTAPGNAWLTSYWRLPEAKLRGGEVNLIDADTGKDIRARLQAVENVKIDVAGQQVTCAHYRLTGGVTVDLWFDGQERLVRQEFVEDGHRTVLTLNRLAK